MPKRLLRPLVRRWRQARDNLLYIVLSLFGDGFSDRKLAATKLLKHAIIQKCFRINHDVPWPVHFTSYISTPEKIDRGSRFPGLSRGCHIDGRNGIQIGRNTWIGPHVRLISMNHDVLDYTKYITAEPIIVGENCWLGAGVTILPGVQLGNHIVVAAGAVVTKSFLENDVVIGGVPASIIRNLEPYAG